MKEQEDFAKEQERQEKMKVEKERIAKEEKERQKVCSFDIPADVIINPPSAVLVDRVVLFYLFLYCL